MWEKYDEQATQYIPLEKLCEFVSSLEPPLHIDDPNYYKLVSLNITICECDLVHCVDILDALTKNFLGTGDIGPDITSDEVAKRCENYTPMTSTLKRQREIYCAKIIQRSWKLYKECRMCIDEREM